MYIVTVKNQDHQTVITKEFETQEEAFQWAVNREFDENNHYEIKEDNN